MCAIEKRSWQRL